MKEYRGIDIFRFVAALLVIAIHTSPLMSYTETGDFILTRIIARVAVPFFFVTSGFFLISRFFHNDDKLKSFLKKTMLIYGVSILLYIPLNIYNDYFKMSNLLPNIIKDLLFDGTIYHLWYLPAAAIGAAIAWLAVKRLGLKKAFILSAALYIVGLFGDSYYGLVEKSGTLKGIYDGLFEIFDYTRNGIFFAPLFFVLGGIIADKSIRISLKGSLIGLGGSLALLLGEGMLLHGLGLQRHDSIYLFLVPTVFFLFNALTFCKGKRMKYIRNSALVIYIIHPMMIVVVRMLAKATGTQQIFIDNSLVHYLAVCILSASAAISAVYLFEKIKPLYKKRPPMEKERAWIEIDYNNLKSNVVALQSVLPNGCSLMAVVKAEAYGHGAFEVAAYINRIGVKAFAVATIDEGIELRRYGIRDEILVLGFTPPSRARELHKYELIQTLIDYDYTLRLNKQGYNIKAHIKIDTGMHRLGFDWNDTAEIEKAFAKKHITVCGIYTHLCASDSPYAEDIGFTKLQLQRFYETVDCLKEREIKIPKTHIQSSYGILNYPTLECDYVRVGLALYGVLSSPQDETRLKLDLRPVLSLKSRVVLIRSIPYGESYGYGRSFVAKRDSKIAILPIGYADGVPRALSCGNGEVLVNGRRAPIVGQICMDQLAVDVTDIELRVGDIVTIIGAEGGVEISAPEQADKAKSISNELLSRMGTRIKKL